MSRRLGLPAVAVLLLGLCGAGPARAQGSFVNFESGHVRPLAMSPDHSRLFAVNTPDNRLAIYQAGTGGLFLQAEVPVGLEPVAVAARTNTEVWVVNHLSDSVSIVQIDTTDVKRSRVVRTLLVGDEPRDIVFAGPNRAFITCARRGQNRFPGSVVLDNEANGPQLTTEGVGRADVWVFNALNLGAALGGTPFAQVQLFGDTPRALAVSPNGATVYAAVFHSGNRTTSISELSIDNNGFDLVPPSFPPGSTTGAPNTGLIVGFNQATNRWEDGETNQDWSPLVNFSLPDQDVFAINANASTATLMNQTTTAISGVGTTIFNMVTRPGSGKLYVSNTEARNNVRFEPDVRGHITESRVTVISGTTPAARHLNPHIVYEDANGVVSPGPQSEIDQTLAFPTDMTFSADGQTLFVAGFGSGKIGAFDADDLEAEPGTITKQLTSVGLGPSGIVLDPTRDQLYVMNRIDHEISIVTKASDPLQRAELVKVPLRFDPSPPAVKNGRRFLYDASSTSGHGDAACASCHVFGDFDSLAWDLGDPMGSIVPNLNLFRLQIGGTPPFHPLKGPMTTQSLRGMANAGPMHWRGDRTGANDCSNVPNACSLDEDAAFKKFNPAFVGLLGSGSQLSAADMQAFTDFILTVKYPPNPIRRLNNTGTTAQNAGDTFFNNTPVDAFQPCKFCHALPLGADGLMSFEGEPQEFKIAHLRNLYQKVGMFGFPGATGNLGPQVRGFGFLHDGSVPTVFLFLNAPVFNFANNTQRRNVEAFSLAFDTGLKPVVGQQVSATPSTFNDANVIDRINTLLILRDEAGDCDLVVKGVLNNQARGWLYDDVSNQFRSDRASEGLVTPDILRGQAATVGQELTYTCVPPGSGIRIGIDRDEDGFFDRTELDALSDPANPASTPGGCG